MDNAQECIKVTKQCACPSGSYGKKHTKECYEAELERLHRQIELLQKSRDEYHEAYWKLKNSAHEPSSPTPVEQALRDATGPRGTGFIKVMPDGSTRHVPHSEIYTEEPASAPVGEAVQPLKAVDPAGADLYEAYPDFNRER